MLFREMYKKFTTPEEEKALIRVATERICYFVSFCVVVLVAKRVANAAG